MTGNRPVMRQVEDLIRSEIMVNIPSELRIGINSEVWGQIWNQIVGPIMSEIDDHS